MNQITPDQLAQEIANLNYKMNILTSEMTLVMEQTRNLIQLQQPSDNGSTSSDS